jgi:hypothetical protein
MQERSAAGNGPVPKEFVFALLITSAKLTLLFRSGFGSFTVSCDVAKKVGTKRNQSQAARIFFIERIPPSGFSCRSKVVGQAAQQTDKKQPLTFLKAIPSVNAVKW